ncbi:transmembrane protein [Purpureocillium lavendulum]|uniref:Transmembrane protein n=1 Tax=Purpureocillium lavendulum TaxID=1247861 RepID=A0AB34FYV3_9HYPO|nr:transmembrane protein [Purpureocillium lavendulum]
MPSPGDGNYVTALGYLKLSYKPSTVEDEEAMLLAPCLATLMFGQLVVPATGQFTQGGSLVSLRPHNITGLRYELYGWTGSYYNGTMKLRVEPQDVDDDDDDDDADGRSCAAGMKPVELTFGNAVLGILKLNHDVPNRNTFAFSLAFPDRNVAGELSLDEVQYIRSVGWMSPDGLPFADSESAVPAWKLNSSFHDGNASYSFTGHRNYTDPQLVEFYHGACNSSSSSASSSTTTAYNGTILEASTRGLTVKSPPLVNGRFDSGVASMEIRGVVVADSRPGARGTRSYIGGPITISFAGRLDANRSDVLLSSGNGTPTWNETLGYTTDPFGSVGSVRAPAVYSWMVGAWTLALLFLLC